MDNYSNDYFMSQEGYASIDFTLLDRPNSNVASAPDSTAALLPDLHLGDSSFPSFDFLDNPGVDAFGGVLRDADEAHSRDQVGYRSDLQKYKKDRPLVQNSTAVHRGDGDADSEVPASEYHIPYESQRPVSNVDFFSQGHTKDSGHQEQQNHQDPEADVGDANHDYFEQGQIPQQAHAQAAAAGGWYGTWAGSNNQTEPTHGFYQTSTYDDASDDRRLMQMKGSSSQLAGQMGYHAHVHSTDAVQKATQSFLPTAKQTDSRQASTVGGHGLPAAQGSAPSSSVAKSVTRIQPYDYEGLMNGSSASQYRQNASSAVETTASTGRHQNQDANLGGQDDLRSPAHGQNYKFPAQNLGALAPVEIPPMKVNDYEFVGSQYGLKGQHQGEVGQHQLAVDNLQAWQQHPSLAPSGQQQASYHQVFQDVSQHHQHQLDQQSQHGRPQSFQQLLGVSHQNQSLGNQLSAFLSESSEVMQEIPRGADRHGSQQLAVANQAALLQTNYQPVNVANSNWSATDASAMEGLAHDYLLGADQNFNWQALALKASQVDPASYGTSIPGNRKDTAGQPLGTYAGMQSGVQDYYAGAAGKLAASNAHVGKSVTRTIGSGGSGGSLYGGDYQADVYEAAKLQSSGPNSKHQHALGKMPFWQNPYPQSVEHSHGTNNLGQTQLPPRSPQVQATSQGRQQRTWSGLSGQQEAQGGLYAHNLANAEAQLKHGFLPGSTVQQNSHNAPNSRQSTRTESTESSHYVQQSSSQAASGSQFINASGAKQQSGWSRYNVQQTVPQTGVSAEAPSNVTGNQKTNWSTPITQQSAADHYSLANLKQQSIWSGHNVQQNSRSPANSLHLFGDQDGRRSGIHGGQDLQQSSSHPSGPSQVGKIDSQLQSSRNLQSNSEPTNTIVDLDTNQQSAWRGHSLLQGTSQNNNSLHAYSDVDKTPSWRSIWQTPASADGSSHMLEMDDTRQQSTLWGHNLQKGTSEAVETQGASINSREHGRWSGHDIQQESSHTDQLLPNLGTEQGSRRSRSMDDRRQSGQFGHLLREEHSLAKAPAEVETRQNANQNAYSLQSQVGLGQTEGTRYKGSLNVYNMPSQLTTAEADARHKTGQNAFNSHSKSRAGEIDARHKASQNVYAAHSHVGNSEQEPLHRTSQKSYTPRQANSGTLDADNQRKGTPTVFSVQSQAGLADADAYKGGNAAYNMQAQAEAFAQPGNMDGRQGRSQWTNNSEQVHTQSRSSMYVYPSMSSENQTAQSRMNMHTWNASVNNVDSWPKGHAGVSGQYQLDVAQVESPDARQQSTQSVSDSQHGSPQKESPLQSLQIARPPSRLGRTQDNSLSANAGLSAAKAATANQWQAQGNNNMISAGGSQGDVLSTWSQGNLPGRKEVDKFSLRETTEAASDGLQAWSRGQSLPGHQATEQVALRRSSTSDANEGSQAWPLGENRPASESRDVNFRDESRANVNKVQSSWSQMQNLSQQKNSEQLTLVRNSSNGVQEAWATWPNRQVVPALNESEQLNLGESTSQMNDGSLPTWTRGQTASARKDHSSGGGEMGQGSKELPIWSRGKNIAAPVAVDQFDAGMESASARSEAVSAWSHEHSGASSRDGEQFNLAGETTSQSRGEAISSWSSRVAMPAAKEVEQADLRTDSSGQVDSLPSWSGAQKVLPQKDAEHLGQAGDANNVGRNSSGKEALIPVQEAEKRPQPEMSFLGAGTRREPSYAASPAPTLETSLFSPAVKKNLAPKVPSLSRNTLDLLNKPEESSEVASVHDEEAEEEELDPEDGCAHASNISLAHLRKNQASGPLSPQGFGLRLAPPSHLSQNAQAGTSSRLVAAVPDAGPHAGQETVPSSLGNRASIQQKTMSGDDQLDAADAGEDGTSGLAREPPVVRAAAGSPYHDSRLKSQEHVSAEATERLSGGKGQNDGSTVQPATASTSTSTSGYHQGLPDVRNSVDTEHLGRAEEASGVQSAEPMVHMASEEIAGSDSPTQANFVAHHAGNIQQRMQYPVSDLQTNDNGGALSKLLSSFKDSISGPAMHTSAQQQGGGNEKRSAGVDALHPQMVKQLNGLQPALWSTESAQLSGLGKAELLKRLAAQNKSVQPVYGQMPGPIDKPTGRESLLGQTALGGQYSSGQLAFGRQQQPLGPGIPGQPVTSGVHHPAQSLTHGQALPGHEVVRGLSQPGQVLHHGYDPAGQGTATNKHQIQPGYAFTSVSGQGRLPDQGRLSDQSPHLVQSFPGQTALQGQDLQGQTNFVQSYPGQVYSTAQGHGGMASIPGLPQVGQVYPHGHSYLPGQTVPFQVSEASGQLGPSQAGSPVAASKQSRARQQRKAPQKATGNDESQVTQGGRLSLPQSQQVAQVQNYGLQFRPNQVSKEGDLPLTVQASQNSTPSGVQSAHPVATDSTGSKDARFGDGRGFEAVERSGPLLGSTDATYKTQLPPQSMLEKYGGRQDTTGSLLQQWQNFQSTNVAPGASDYQIQRFIESRPAVAAALEPYKGEPHLYQRAAAQLYSTYGQPQMTRQYGHYQQQHGTEQLAVSGSSSSSMFKSDGSSAAQAFQAAQVHAAQSMQSSQSQNVQAAHALTHAQAAQSMQTLQSQNMQAAHAHAHAQAQAALSMQPSQSQNMQAAHAHALAQAQAAQSMHPSQSQNMQAAHAHTHAQAQAAQSMQPSQSQDMQAAHHALAHVQPQGHAAMQPLQTQNAQAVHARALQDAYAHAQALQAAKAAQAMHVAQASHAAHAAQSAHAAQAAQIGQAAQAAQSVHAGAKQPAEAIQAAQASQAAQAAIHKKNASTAARLQSLSQLAQGGQHVNGLAAPWMSGLAAARSGNTVSHYPSRIAEDPIRTSSVSAQADERPGYHGASGNQWTYQKSQSAPPVKKRKELAALEPWREVISQSGGYVSSTSASESEWAAATNRVADQETYDEPFDTTDQRSVVLHRAKRRLRLTTHLMQQITPPVAATFMQSKSVDDRESATYTVSKLAFAEACRISSIARRIRDVAAARDAEESKIEKERELALKEAEKTGQQIDRLIHLQPTIADRFKLRIKQLENDLQRLENAPSAADLIRNMQDAEKSRHIQRLAAYQSPRQSRSLERLDGAIPEKYVKAVHMPKELPEGIVCVPL